MQQSETRRVYDGMDVVQERDGSNVVTANYTRSGNIGGLLARTTSSGHFYYHYDGSGNVMQLTDAAQATVAQYTYDAYGVLQSAIGLQAGQPYRYSTKEYHDYSGLYDYGYRFYSPNLGRWLNRDPIRERGGLNLYAMVNNDPVNLVDDYGLDPGGGGRSKIDKFLLPESHMRPIKGVDMPVPKTSDVDGDGRTDWDFPNDKRVGKSKLVVGIFGSDNLTNPHFIIGIGVDVDGDGQLDPPGQGSKNGEIKRFIGACVWGNGWNGGYIEGDRWVHWISAESSDPGARKVHFIYDTKDESF